MNVLRAREERVEVGVLSPLREGKPIHGEVVKLVARPEAPRLFDVETQLEAPRATDASRPAEEARATAGRPAQVASDSYRKNWDAIFQPAPEDAAEPDLLN